MYRNSLIAIVLAACCTAPLQVGAQSTLQCRTVIECAQLAVEISATSQQAIEALNTEISDLRGQVASLQAELEQLKTNTSGQLANLDERINAVQADTSNRIANGQVIQLRATNGSGCVHPAGGGRAEKSIYMAGCDRKLFHIER